MPAIITLSHQKGGCGKSTLALNLASYYAIHGTKCALVDTDLQGSITDTYASFEDKGLKPPVDLIKRQDFKEFSELLQMDDYELLVIDTPPVMTAQLKDLFQISNFVLIPMKPAVNDFFALNRTIKFIENFVGDNPNVKTGIVLNMAINSSDIQKDIRNALEGSPILVMDTEVGQRVEFMRCTLYSTNIFETNDNKAKAEIEKLGEELYSLLIES